MKSVHPPVKEPPFNNMGATITTTMPQIPDLPLENRCLLDWVSFTLPEGSDPIDIIQMMHLDPKSFTALGGSMGYKSSLRLGHISVFYDGTKEMGVHVSISGQGCREYEALGHNSWRELFAFVHLKKGHFTRLDIAFDTVDESLKLSTVWKSIKKGEIKSTISAGRKIEKFTLSKKGTLIAGDTIYLGSPTSCTQFRFYDKAAQLEIDSPWVRLEIQLRKDRAENFSQEIVKGRSAVDLGTGVINNYFTFINLDDSNRSRCSTKSWWSAWLLHTSKLKLVKAKAQKVVHDLMSHLEQQYAATFAVIAESVSPKVFGGFFAGLLHLGRKRMTGRHQQIIQATKALTSPIPHFQSLNYCTPF